MSTTYAGKENAEMNSESSSTITNGNLFRTVNILQDPCGPYQVDNNVKYVVHSWAALVPVHPEHFLQRLLESRGFRSPPNLQTSSYRRPPSLKQLQDYDNALVWAVRRSDLHMIASMWAGGTCMNASNKYGESILHQACRRSEFNVVAFILSHGGDAAAVDDCGRTPLHDACWRSEPHFGIVTLLMDISNTLIKNCDQRGNTPLSYCQEKHYLDWCAYFYHQRNRYWPEGGASSSSSNSTTSNSSSTENQVLPVVSRAANGEVTSQCRTTSSAAHFIKTESIASSTASDSIDQRVGTKRARSSTAGASSRNSAHNNTAHTTTTTTATASVHTTTTATATISTAATITNAAAATMTKQPTPSRQLEQSVSKPIVEAAHTSNIVRPIATEKSGMPAAARTILGSSSEMKNADSFATVVAPHVFPIIAADAQGTVFVPVSAVGSPPQQNPKTAPPTAATAPASAAASATASADVGSLSSTTHASEWQNTTASSRITSPHPTESTSNIDTAGSDTTTSTAAPASSAESSAATATASTAEHAADGTCPRSPAVVTVKL